MASAAIAQPPMVAGRFEIDFGTPLPGAAGAHRAFAARQSRGEPTGWMAVQVARGWTVRARELGMLPEEQIANLLLPVAHGAAPLPSGETGYFVICPAPPGPALSATPRAWPEAESVDSVLRPVASVLLALQRLKVTHRSICPANLFQAVAGAPVTLGPGWAAPPAAHQGAVFEPPYAAMCRPAGCGDGTIADDVYALGVTLIILTLGFDPTASEDADVIIQRKLDLGSYAAIIGTHRLPQGMADLVRGMLADDPDHRPSPTLLCDPPAARARRIAANPPRRAIRALECGPVEVWNGRQFGFATLRYPEQTLATVNSAAFDLWLRRGIGDAALIAQVDELRRIRASEPKVEDPRADATLLAGLVAVFDPLAPLVWCRMALWPDAMGSALFHALHATPPNARLLADIVEGDIIPLWAMRRPGRTDLAILRLDNRQNRYALVMPQPTGGVLRLAYTLNPLAPCGSSLLARGWVVSVTELLPLLEQVAPTAAAAGPPLDEDILCFVSVRRDRADSERPRLAQAAMSLDGVAQLTLLAHLQERLRPGRLPNLAQWMTSVLKPAVEAFSSVSRRQRLTATLAELAKAGLLAPMRAALTADGERADDRSGHKAAKARVAAIDRELAGLIDTTERRRGAGSHAGREIGAGVGLLAIAVGTFMAAF